MVLPVIILGGIYGGLFTPTEAGAIGALYSFIILVFVLKDIKIKELPQLFKDSVRTMVQIFYFNRIQYRIRPGFEYFSGASDAGGSICSVQFDSVSYHAECSVADYRMSVRSGVRLY